MPKIVGRNERGFVDPLSLFGLLFLVVTLAAVTFVTTNKNISLNIQEKAAKPGKTGNSAFDKCREESGREVCNERLGINVNWKGEIVNEIDTSNVNKDAPQGQPTCDANGVQYSPGAVVMYGGIGSNATCGSDGKWDVGVGNITDIKPENVPEYAKEAVEKEKAVEAEKQAVEQQEQKTECTSSGGVWLGNECGTAEQRVETIDIDPRFGEKEPVTNIVTEYKDSTGNVVYTDTLPDVTIQNTQIAGRRGADLIYQTTIRDQEENLIYSSSLPVTFGTSSTVEKTDEGFITHSTTYVRDARTGKIVDAKTTSYIAKTTTTTTQNQGNTVQTSLTSYINPDTGQYYTDSTGKAIINITGLSIIPPLAKKAGGQTCSDSSECGSGSCAYSVNSLVGVSKTCQKEILPNNNYGSCNGDPTCNSALTSIDRGMNAISFGGWSNYTEAYSPDKVKYTWQESGYKSVKECQDDMIAKNNNAQAAASCNTYQITKEQAISSIKLGTTLTAEAAAIIALPGAIAAGGAASAAPGAAWYAGTLAAGGSGLTTFGAVSTLLQTSGAAVAQITDPGSPEAWKQTGYAALSWLNIGTADKLIKSFGALDAAKKAGQATEILVTAAQSARNLNNVVSGINLAVDVPNAVSTCSQAGFFTGSCGGALAAVGADIVFGTVDYKQGQLGFGNPLEKVKFTPSRQLDMFDQLARDPIANTSTVVNNGTELIFPDKPARQDPNTNFNLTKSDPNEVAAIAAFNSTDINTQGGAVAQLTPSDLNSQIPNTIHPDSNLANAPNASVLDKANGVIDTLPDTGGAISIVKKINQIGDEIAKVDVNTPKPLRDRLFGEPKTKKFSNVKTGETILIKPGDTIRTGNFETKMPKPDDYPDGIFWTKNPGDTPQRLTGEGVPITKGNSAENINFADKDGGRIAVDVVEHTTDANGRPITKPTASTAITLTDELNVQTTITRAASETGLLTFRGPDGEWFPGLKKLFGNGKPAAPTSNEAVIDPSEKLVDPETSANNSGATNNEKTVSTAEELFDHFKKEYKSELPENLVVHKDPNDFYSFQQELIDAAKNGEVTNEFLAQKMKDLQGRGNVTFVIKDPGEINDISGGIAYTQKVLNPKTGNYEVTVFLPSPADLAEYKNIDIETARVKIAELIGHESGHAYDEAGLLAIGINPNSAEGLWASEYLQQNFSNEFQKALGVENPVKDGFVKGVEAQANIVKNTSGEPLPATKQPSALAAWWDSTVVKPLGDLVFGNPVPKTLDTANIPTTTKKTFTGTVFGEPKTVKISKNTGEITLKPGDIVDTAHWPKMKIPDPNNYDHPIYWQDLGAGGGPQGPITKLTSEGITINPSKGNGNVYLNFSNLPEGSESITDLKLIQEIYPEGGREIKNGAASGQMIISQSYRTPVITHANPVPGLLSVNSLAKAWGNNVVKPLGNFLFGNSLPNTTIDLAFQRIWGPKLNKIEKYTNYELIKSENFDQMKLEGKIPESWVVVHSDIPGAVKVNIAEEYNPYKQLLERAQDGVALGNKSPEQAVSDLMGQKIGSEKNSGLFESLNFNLSSQESLAGKVWCGTANCVQQSMVAKQLLADLGVPNTQIIYGLGGDLPFVHSAIVTPKGVILYGGTLIPTKTFIRYTNMVKALGKYFVPAGFDSPFTVKNIALDGVTKIAENAPSKLPTPQTKSTSIFGFELRSPIGTDGKLQLPFEKTTVPVSEIPVEIDLNKLKVKDVPSWENVKNKEVATVIDVENIDSIPPLKGRDFTPQVKSVRELYPVEIVNNIFFSEKSADSGRKLVQDYLQALKNGEDISKYQEIAKSFLNAQEKVYGTQSQSAKSKLADWISRNYNDVDVNSLPTENIDDLALVRVMSSPDPIGVDPYGNVVIQSTFLGNPQKDAESLYRTSKHFTVNGAVAPVQTAYGRIADWSAGDVIVITPMNEFVKINGTPNTFAVQDTWWTPGTYDNLVLPKGTVLIIKDGSEALKEYANLPGVLIIKSENPYRSSRGVLEELGYQYKAQGTEYSEPNTPEEVFLNESVFAYNIGANSGLHFDSPTMNVGNELSTRLLTDETINHMSAWSEGNLSRHQRLNTVVDLIQDGYFSHKPINGLYIPPERIPNSWELTPDNFDGFTSPLTNSQIKAVEDIISNEKLTLPNYWENQGVIAEYQQLIKDSFVDPTLSSGLPLLKPDIFGLTNEDTNFLRENVNELTKTTIPVSEKLVTENLDATDNTIKLNETPEQSKPTIFGFELRSPISTDGKLQLPFGKVNTPISEIPVEPEANRIPIVSKEEQITNLTNPSYSVDQSSPFITIQETAPTAVEPLNKSSFFLNSTEPKIAGWEGQTDQALQRTIASKGYQEATSGIKMPDQLQTYAAPTAGRTDFIILDQPIEDSLGNRFPTLQRKGVGTVREILADQDSSKLFGAPSLKDPAIYPILGSTYQYGYDLDVKASTLWASKGLRVRMPYGEYKLITVFDGGKAVNLTINSDNPQIISIWATRNPLTLEDFNKVNLMAYNTSKLPELVSDTLKNQAYFLQFETDPIAQSLSKSLLTDPKTHSKEWIDWLASTYGAQTGIKTGEGLFSGEMHRQNLSLTPEFRDLGDNPDNPNLEKYKTSPIPFIQITDPEYKRGMIQEVFYVLGGVLNTNGIINVAYGHNVYTNDLAQNLTSTATKFFKGFAASDYSAYRAFLESVGSGQEFYLHEFVRAYEISVDAYGFSNLGTNYGINIYDIIRGVIKQQLLENGITTVTSSSLLTQIDVENYHRVQSVEPVENAIAQAAPPYQPATTTSENPSILTQVQDWWKANIADEQGFLPPVRRFLNPVPTQKLTTDEVTNLINNTNGPIIEVGGPTPGYKQVYIPELNRNIYVSNIETGTPVIENGVQIGSTVNGHVDLLTNSTKLPFADNSVGAIFGSALEEQTIPQTLSEAYRTLKPDGVLVLQNAKSIENQAYAGIIAEAEKLGFKPLSNIEIYRFPGKSDNVLRDLVFQKTEIITPSPPLTGFAKVQEQAGTVVKAVFSPLKYVAGGIISAAFLDDYFNWGIIDYIETKISNLIPKKQIDGVEMQGKIIFGNNQVEEPTTSEFTPDQGLKIDTVVKTNEQQKLELERQAKIKSGLYAQIDADLATQTILGGAGKPFKNIGCGQVAVANILCEYSNYCPTPIQIANQIPLEDYGTTGLTSSQSNIKILNENGFTTDPYTKSLQYHLTDYMEPTDVLWISGVVGGIDHHTYINGYTLDKNGIAIYNLNDSYFGDGYKCKTSGDSSFSCDNPDGSHINIGAENANIYIIDTNI